MEFHELDVYSPEITGGAEVSETDTVTIAPLGDVHMFPDLFADNAFKTHLKYIEDTYPNVYYIGMGDYVDVASPSNRQKIRSAALYDTTLAQFDEVAEKRVDEFLELTHHTAGRWLGMIEGHHMWEFKEGHTSNDLIRQGLDAPNLKDCADIEIRFLRKDNNGARGIVNIWVHHGQGYRKYPLGLLTELAGHFPNNDAMLMGHYHKAQFDYFPRIVRRGQHNISYPALLMVTGGWLKQYVPGKESYIEKKAKPPRAIGGAVFTVKPSYVKGFFVPKFEVHAPSY